MPGRDPQLSTSDKYWLWFPIGSESSLVAARQNFWSPPLPKMKQLQSVTHVVCTDLPPGSHKKLSYIGCSPCRQSPACPSTAQSTETEQITTWTLQRDNKVQRLN
ncbi:unnamed protein product [Pleuronectes platessa]|uniref:Uncharacterized protein n=1 Tax=Pleuronectes platessa TaxID=8262 RepID=A0A9N7VR73_PLEPL|nr:unnamed protein product [Pleuronectes platessa]